MGYHFDSYIWLGYIRSTTNNAIKLSNLFLVMHCSIKPFKKTQECSKEYPIRVDPTSYVHRM
jgi:hypothetical protein